jgi:hypothetical protein
MSINSEEAFDMLSYNADGRSICQELVLMNVRKKVCRDHVAGRLFGFGSIADRMTTTKLGIKRNGAMEECDDPTES